MDGITVTLIKDLLFISGGFCWGIVTYAVAQRFLSAMREGRHAAHEATRPIAIASHSNKEGDFSGA